MDSVLSLLRSSPSSTIVPETWFSHCCHSSFSHPACQLLPPYFPLLMQLFRNHQPASPIYSCPVGLCEILLLPIRQLPFLSQKMDNKHSDIFSLLKGHNVHKHCTKSYQLNFITVRTILYRLPNSWNLSLCLCTFGYITQLTSQPLHGHKQFWATTNRLLIKMLLWVSSWCHSIGKLGQKDQLFLQID